MPSPESLGSEERRLLLDLAHRSIRGGFSGRGALDVPLAGLAPVLCEPRATFVTLKRSGQLRGCVGTLEAVQPLARDVAASAYRAAFGDPRFPPLRPDECDDLQLHIAVLGPLEPVEVSSRSELLAVLRPKIDGLLIEQGPLRATFLPAVWASLPEPEAFVRELERKAGFPEDVWRSGVRCRRYAVEEWGD
jgi:AmmeMemoRadiSam system protein A